MHNKLFSVLDARLCIVAILLLVVACASKPKAPHNPDTVEVIHLTSSDTTRANLNNPRQENNVVIGTADPNQPILVIESNDGLPEDKPVTLALPTDDPAATPTQTPAPTTPLTTPSHQVGVGDTLYSIARAYNKDIVELARINNIDSSFTIYPGQVLSLDTQKPFDGIAALNQTKTPQPQQAPQQPAQKPTPPPKPKATVAKKPHKVKDGRNWIWPVDGRAKILRGFSANKQESIKGIDIAGKQGDAIYATGDGLVVYAGNELELYGNLIIISHGETFISAYAHNNSLLVQEGEEVREGQKIATMGDSGTNETKLFFQIRKESIPVDPVGYLPPRK